MINVNPWLKNGGTRKHTTTIVMHATAGREHPDSSAQNAIDTLRERGLSYNYIIARDGTVYKGVPLANEAWHAGVSFGPDGSGCNGYSIGISFVNLDDGHELPTVKQTEAARLLILDLKAAYPSIKHLTTHAIVSPKRKVDPLGYDIDHLGNLVDLPVWRPH